MHQYHLTLDTSSLYGPLPIKINSSILPGLTPREVVSGDGEFPKV